MRPSRTAPRVTFYPAFLALRGRVAVVIGGGRIAEQKVRSLLDAEARVTVVSRRATVGLAALAARGSMTLIRRAYRRGDLAGAFLAIAATDNPTVNRAVWREAEEGRVLLNAVDDVAHCHFIAPALYRQGDLQVAVSSGGKSPAVAVRVRDRIAGALGPEYEALLDLLGKQRSAMARRVPDAEARKAVWYAIVDSEVPDRIRVGDRTGAKALIAELVDRAARGRAAPGRPRVSGRDALIGEGVVYLVGAGPGDPGLITAKGLAILRRADVVVHDRLVHPALVGEAAPWAERIVAARHPSGAGARQAVVNDILVARARAGACVVRLKGGDPFVFGRGAEECEALRAAGVRFYVVPGVSAAVAVPTAAGIPVTHRRYASAFAVVTGHECDGSSDLDWAALANVPTLVVMMGLERWPAIAARLLALGKSPDTPAAAVASGTLAEQRLVIATLATLRARVREARLMSPVTIVIGSVVAARVTSLGQMGRVDTRPARSEPLPVTLTGAAS